MAKTTSLGNLLHILSEASRENPKFMLFLGAGASVTSGIPSGRDLVKAWRESFNKNASNTDQVAEKQEWHGTPAEYGKLFESLYQTPRQRRDFIEKCVESASPSWGYLYLADLLDHGYFNVVLTTNFDDLINEACYSFTPKLRPLVCSHDASIKLFPINTPRPKIIKLHGDYLFDNIKNTMGELAALEANTREKFGRLAENFGLVVVGFGGGDESIMAAIGNALQDPQSFPNGIYWCLQDSSKMPPRLQSFTDDPRLHLVKIDDFDSFMADVHSAIVEDSPEVISDPLGQASRRLSHLLHGLHLPESIAAGKESIIKRDLSNLGKSIGNPGETKLSIDLPSGFVGAVEFTKGHYENARKLLLSELRTPNPTVGTAVLFFECLRHSWDQDAFNEFARLVEEGAARPQVDPSWMLNATLSLLHANRFSEAEQIARLAEIAFKANADRIQPHVEAYNAINIAQIILHRGNQLDSEQKWALRELLSNRSEPTVHFGCHILLGDYSKAIEVVRNTPGAFSSTTSDWPIVKLLPSAELNQLKELVGTGPLHFGEMRLNFNMPIKRDA